MDLNYSTKYSFPDIVRPKIMNIFTILVLCLFGTFQNSSSRYWIQTSDQTVLKVSNSGSPSDGMDLNFPDSWRTSITKQLPVWEIPSWISTYKPAAFWKCGGVIVVKEYITKDPELDYFEEKTHHKLLQLTFRSDGSIGHVGWPVYSVDKVEYFIGFNFSASGWPARFDTRENIRSPMTTQLGTVRVRARNSN